MATKVLRILIVNSDSPNNRGDRAILAGEIRLIRSRFPTAELWAQSEWPERDSTWFGIHFLRMSVHSTNPLDLMRLAWFARACTLVLWGGGELLKDYTNKLGLLYWVFKILLIRAFNHNLYGICQGIGRTHSKFGRRLIVIAVNQTRHFLVRDEESKERLRTWGVRAPITATFDPAIMCKAAPLSRDEFSALHQEFDVSPGFLTRCVGIGPRRWFHYKTGGWLPFRMRLFPQQQVIPSSPLDLYASNLAQFCDRLIEEKDLNILFFPMHMALAENDAGFSRDIVRRMRNRGRAKILDHDTLSPAALHNTVAACSAFIGFRLHSFILATTSCVPALVYYYVDKGRLYADQVGMAGYAQPIETWLGSSAAEQAMEALDSLVTDGDRIKAKLVLKVDSMRADLVRTFEALPFDLIA